MKKGFLLIFLLVFICCNESQDKPSKSGTLITDVSIIDVTSGTVLENQFIAIDSGKIKRISSSVENKELYNLIIDGKGKFALPGLAEMHAHIPSPPISKEQLEQTLFLYLSNGITTIRGMLGHPSHLELRKQVERGEVLSPRIFTSSPSLNGNTVKTPEEAKDKVTSYQKDGYDFLKIHPGIQRPVFEQVIQTANEVGIPYAGHVPVDVGIKLALESNYATVDHVDGFLEGLVPTSQNVNPNNNGFFGYNFAGVVDTTQIAALVQLSKEHKVWIVPTQSLFERWFAPISAEELILQPEMKYMPVTTLMNWKIRKDQSTGNATNFDKEQWQKFITIRRQLIKALQKDGYGMLLGSDAPQLFNVPGFSIHHEMAGMLRAGMTPIEILQAGTINPAVFFDKEDSFGQIKEGLEADLLLVNANPIDDIEALKKLTGVMIQGKWLDKKTIDKKLKVIAAYAQNQ
ncbi:MAG: amidohydrolase family protein [Eudoraea sp.]|nr:amidohydrolase family protein [Eudoraea sp.]